ncbi:MAG: hypothetical protein IJ310_01055 [Clostridia bacterium]|nr:hypothetical protein [Clostridia bacterium]
MPIGPSHGGRGGGGRSSSSGSSGGGNLLGSIVGGVIGGMLTAGTRRRRRERYYGNGGGDSYESNEPATPSRRRPTVFLVLAIVIAVITFFTVTIRNGFANSAETQTSFAAIMKTDYAEYKDLIDTARAQDSLADNDPSKTHFITTATFSKTKYTSYKANPTAKGIYQDFTLNNVQYYFIVYTYQDESGVTHTGTTYSQFSSTQATGWDGEIAYAKIDGQYVSMNTSYTSNAIEECAEYKYTLAIAESNKQLASRTIWVIVGEVLIIALLVTLYILKLKKYRKLVKQDEEAYAQVQQANVNEAQAKAEAAQKDADKKNRVCAFCGSTVPDGEDVCPACGSRTFE